MTEENWVINYNTPNGIDGRRDAVPLTLKEEMEIASDVNNWLLREKIAGKQLDEKIKRWQSFLDHYQNMVYFFDAHPEFLGNNKESFQDGRNVFGMIPYAQKL